MSDDLFHRVTTKTGANANLIQEAGTFITGDGHQTVYVSGGSPGDAIVVGPGGDLGFGAPGGGSDHKVKVDGADTTAGFLDDKLVAGAGITFTILNVAGNEQIEISASGGGGGAGVYAAFYRNPVAGFGTIAIDAAVPFDSDGPSQGGIIRSGVSPSEFVLPTAGTYDVSWMVSVDEAGQLALFLDDGAGYLFQPQTLAGRATGTNQITNRVLITTTTANALIKIVNHSSPAALTMTPLPGGTSAGATYLVICQPGANGATGAAGPAGPPGASNKMSTSVTFLDNEEAVQAGAGVGVAASTGRNFAIFQAGATITYHLVFAGFNGSASAIVTDAKLRIYVNCTSSTTTAGGTMISEVPVPETSITMKTDTGTFVAPAGAGFVCVALLRGQDDGGPFPITVNSVGVTFVGNGA